MEAQQRQRPAVLQAEGTMFGGGHSEYVHLQHPCTTDVAMCFTDAQTEPFFTPYLKEYAENKDFEGEMLHTVATAPSPHTHARTQTRSSDTDPKGGEGSQVQV